MLGLLLLYFIGKAFYNLAKKHERNKWVFAILGVVTYYGMAFIGATLIVIIIVSSGNDSILNYPDTVIGLMGVPVGLLAVWGLHYMLRKNWESNPKDLELLDDNTF